MITNNQWHCRYEHTSEIIRYNLRINVHPTAMYGDLLSPAYTVSLYDTPGKEGHIHKTFLLPYMMGLPYCILLC